MPIDSALASLNLTLVRGCIFWLLPVSRRCSFIVCILHSSRGYAFYRDDHHAGEKTNGGMVILVEDPLCTLLCFSYKLMYTLLHTVAVWMFFVILCSLSALQTNPVFVMQLQRIVSRCKCEFFYAGYGVSSIDPSTLDEVPPPLSDEGGPWEKRERAVDAFTLMHHDLDVCTNSLQVLNFNYYMLCDVCHFLKLYGCSVSSRIDI